MKKISIEWTEDENGYFPQEDVDMHLQASAMRLALWDIAQNIFRPARKHGYSDPKLEALLTDQSADLVGLLEEKFYEILAERGIDLG